MANTLDSELAYGTHPDDDLRPRGRSCRDEPPRDRDPGRLGAVDAADDEHPVGGGRVPEDDRADRSAVDARPDRERGQEKGKEAHLHAIRSQLRWRSVHSKA